MIARRRTTDELRRLDAAVSEMQVKKDVAAAKRLLAGDYVFLTGRALMKATYKGKQLGREFLYTDVWVKRQSRWQIVLSQATLRPPTR